MVLRFGVIHSPPATCLQDNCPQRGFYIDAIDTVCRKWRLDCIFEMFNSTDYGDVDQNGVASGLLGAVLRGEYDATLPIITPSYRRHKGVAFSGTYRVDDIVLTTRSPTVAYKSTNWNMLYAFSWDAWLCLFVASGLVSLCASIAVVTLERSVMISCAERAPNRLSTRLSLTFVRSMSRLLTNGTPTPDYPSMSIRILTCVWLFLILVLGSAYSSVLVQMRVLSKPNLPFDDLSSFVRCLETRRCRLITSPVSPNTLQRLLPPETEYGRRIAKAFEYNPPVIERSHTTTAKRILEETDHYVVATAPMENVLTVIKDNKDCSFYIMAIGAGDVSAFATRKGSPILPLLDRIASVYREGDLHRAAIRMGNYLPGARCDGAMSRRGTGNVNETASLRSSLVIYGIGLMSSVIAFVIERVMGRMLRS